MGEVTLEQRVDELEAAVGRLQKNYDELDGEVESIQKTLATLSQKQQEFINKAEQIVKEGTAGTPKWVLWFIAVVTVPMGLAAFAEVLYAILSHH